MTFSGVYAPLATPFDDEDRVDVARMTAAFSRWVASPLAGLVVLGTNSEAGLLDEREAETVIDTARALTPRTKTLIAGTGRESTQASVRAARRAAELGADAVLVRTPSFFKARMNDDTLVRYYATVADASPVPVLLYNFTAATGVNLHPSTVARLADHPNIAGIKESGSDIAQIADLVSLTPPGFSVLAGSATTFFAAMNAGVRGGILALAGLLPELCVRLCDLVMAGQLAEARLLQRRLVPIARLISTVHGVPGLKAALHLTGVDVGRPRPPLLPLDDIGISSLRAALSTLEEITV